MMVISFLFLLMRTINKNNETTENIYIYIKKYCIIYIYVYKEIIILLFFNVTYYAYTTSNALSSKNIIHVAFCYVYIKH